MCPSCTSHLSELKPADFKYHVRFFDYMMSAGGPISWSTLAKMSEETAYIWEVHGLDRGRLRGHAKYRQRNDGWTLKIFDDE